MPALSIPLDILVWALALAFSLAFFCIGSISLAARLISDSSTKTESRRGSSAQGRTIQFTLPDSKPYSFSSRFILTLESHGAFETNEASWRSQLLRAVLHANARAYVICQDKTICNELESTLAAFSAGTPINLTFSCIGVSHQRRSLNGGTFLIVPLEEDRPANANSIEKLWHDRPQQRRERLPILVAIESSTGEPLTLAFASTAADVAAVLYSFKETIITLKRYELRSLTTSPLQLNRLGAHLFIGDLHHPLLRIQDGRAIHLSSIPEIARGKSGLLNIWGTWCGPCIAEIPLLHAIETAAPHIALIGLLNERDLRASKEISTLLTTIDQLRPTRSQYLINEPDSLIRELSINAYPTFIFFTGEGRIEGALEGSLLETQNLAKLLQWLSMRSPPEG